MSNYLVIGGSSGIGNAVVQRLLQDGHKVIASFRNHEPSANLSVADWFTWDVSENFPSHVLPESLDGLLYCPGAINLKPFQRCEISEFEQDYSIQVLGAVKAIQAALPALRASKNASIVLFSTVAVQTGFPFHSIVSASKGAIEGLVRALAAELAPSIRVNAIAPSLTDTPLASRLLAGNEKRKAAAERHPLRRVGTAYDQAQAAVFLLTDASAWITGQILHVDGGMSNLKV